MILFGFFTSSKAVQLWQLYFTYSICCGLSIGIAYNIMISVIPLYFQDKVGLATGILLMGFAMSTTLLGPFCEKGLSVMGWRGVFLILGICEAAVFLAGSVGIHMPLKNQKEGLPEAQKTRRSRESLPPRRMLRRKSFYVFLTIYIAIGGGNVTDQPRCDDASGGLGQITDCKRSDGGSNRARAMEWGGVLGGIVYDSNWERPVSYVSGDIADGSNGAGN